MRSISMSFGLVTKNFKNPLGTMCAVFLFDPYPIFGFLISPRTPRRAEQSIPRGTRQAASFFVPPMRLYMCAWKRVNFFVFFFTIAFFAMGVGMANFAAVR